MESRIRSAHHTVDSWAPPSRESLDRPAGYSLLELTFVLALTATVGAMAAPPLLTSVDQARAEGAVHYVSAMLHRARMQAVVRSVDVALQFAPTDSSFAVSAHMDGNRNGVRTTDIQSGIDRPVSPAERLPDRFPDVDFGVLAGLPPIDAGGQPPGSDPVKLGSSNLLTFTPLGTSSSGTLYVLGRRNLQYAIRVYGETGKVRTLRFDSQKSEWKPL